MTVIKTTLQNFAASVKNIVSVSERFAGNPYHDKGGFTQRDNQLRPSGSCNVTAAANALDCLGLKIFDNENTNHLKQPEDKLFAMLESEKAYKEFKKYVKDFDPKKSEVRPRHYSEMIAWVSNEATKVKTAIWKERTFDEIIKAVSDKYLVIISGAFSASGHFILLKGQTEKEFWVDDSWGDFTTAYKNKNGHNVKYTKELIRTICFKGEKKRRTIVFVP